MQGAPTVGVDHLALGVWENLTRVLERALVSFLGVAPVGMRTCSLGGIRLRIIMAMAPGGPEGTLLPQELSGPAKAGLDLAADEAKRMGRAEVGPEELLLGLIAEGSCALARRPLSSVLPLEEVRAAIRAARDEEGSAFSGESRGCWSLKPALAAAAAATGTGPSAEMRLDEDAEVWSATWYGVRVILRRHIVGGGGSVVEVEIRDADGGGTAWVCRGTR